MSRVSRRSCFVGLCCAVVAGSAAYFAVAQEQSPKPEDKPEEAANENAPPAPVNQRVEDALELPIGEWSFSDTPLAEIVFPIKDKYGIEVQLDVKSLMDATVSADSTTFTREVSKIKLGAALDLVLAEHDLSYLVRDGILLITTREEADSQVETRVYPVGDLVDPPGPKGDKAAPYKEFIEILSVTIDPASWDKGGGPGSVASFPKGEALVVQQTWRTHHKIETLLADLRKAKQTVAARASKDR